MAEAVASSPPVAVQQNQKPATSAKRDYKGFVAGVFSGIAKLSGMFISTLFLIIILIKMNSRPPLRHSQGPPPDDAGFALQRPAAVRPADGAQ